MPRRDPTTGRFFKNEVKVLPVEQQRALLEQRLRERMIIGPPEECWVWTGWRTSTGYGGIDLDGKKKLKAHRAAYMVWKDWDLLPEHDIRHMCHNRLCCNPHHLQTGTRKENINDSVRDGRIPLGEAKTQAKLTDQTVLEIRRMWPGKGYTQQQLADRYGVTISVICEVLHRKVWKHLP